MNENHDKRNNHKCQDWVRIVDLCFLIRVSNRIYRAMPKLKARLRCKIVHPLPGLSNSERNNLDRTVKIIAQITDYKEKNKREPHLTEQITQTISEEPTQKTTDERLAFFCVEHHVNLLGLMGFVAFKNLTEKPLFVNHKTAFPQKDGFFFISQ